MQSVPWKQLPHACGHAHDKQKQVIVAEVDNYLMMMRRNCEVAFELCSALLILWARTIALRINFD